MVTRVIRLILVIPVKPAERVGTIYAAIAVRSRAVGDRCNIRYLTIASPAQAMRSVQWEINVPPCADGWLARCWCRLAAPVSAHAVNDHS